jgi:cytochrome d ubiquinol oxidase subunit II
MLRVVSFEWRGKADSLRWRRGWLCANAIGSVGAPLIWGIALANLLHGVPLDSNGDFNGSFTDLFSFYTVLVGIATVALFAFHGAAFLTLKTSGDLEQRARSAAQRLSVPAAGLVVLALGFTVAVAVDRNHKSITAPLVVAIVAGLALLVAVGAVVKRRTGIAFALTAVSTLLFVATIFTSLYPRVLVSAPNFANSLTVTNSASAHYTLAVMSVVALTITPIVLLYQAWTYIVFRDRVTTQP